MGHVLILHTISGNFLTDTAYIFPKCGKFSPSIKLLAFIRLHTSESPVGRIVTHMSPKTLVILACSHKKASKPVAARDLYLGSLFKLGRKFAEIHHFDYVIISAKYGLLRPDDIIAPYDQRIANMTDVRRVRELVLPPMQELLRQYEKIVVIGGSLYRKVLDPVKSAKFEEITDSRGIGGLLQQLRRRIDTEISLGQRVHT